MRFWMRSSYLERAVLDRLENVPTVGDDGYQRIRTDILFAKLRPAQKLRLEALREAYGVSVSTLREILNRLASEGLVLAEGRPLAEGSSVGARALVRRDW